MKTEVGGLTSHPPPGPTATLTINQKGEKNDNHPSIHTAMAAEQVAATRPAANRENTQEGPTGSSIANECPTPANPAAGEQQLCGALDVVAPVTKTKKAERRTRLSLVGAASGVLPSGFAVLHLERSRR